MEATCSPCDHLLDLMSLRGHVRHLSSRIQNPTEHIWISEDALDHAIRRFFHIKVPRRYVGLAPGPLEARKRATKRRMMDLAPVGNGIAADLGLLPRWGGMQDGNLRWQEPTPAVLRKIEDSESFSRFNGLRNAEGDQNRYPCPTGLLCPMPSMLKMEA